MAKILGRCSERPFLLLVTGTTLCASDCTQGIQAVIFKCLQVLSW